jgi:Holliday junction resolvase RusA-like endonuclease
MFIFEIHGNPVPQKQTRFSCHGNRPHAYDPSKKDKEFIQWQIKPFAPDTPLTGPIELTIIFFLPIPKSASSKKRIAMRNRVILPITKPDEDNLAYIVTNALKKIVYEDDSQVCAKHVYKYYGADPKTVIKVRPITQIDEVGCHDNDI